MDPFESMRVFVAVAEEEGFAPAARRLAMSPSSVTRCIAALEERLGAQLLQRTTRVVRLTETGARFLADTRHILAALEEAEAAAAESRAEPRGELVISASFLFGRMHVAPLLFDFLDAHPFVTCRAIFEDRRVDLAREGVDVAIRIGDLPDSSNTAIRVGSLGRVVCASPDYLARRGTPTTPADLRAHGAIGFAGAPDERDWLFGSGDGAETVSPSMRLVVNTAEVAIAAAIAGHGFTRVVSYMIEPHVKSGRLVRVLEDHAPPRIPVHVVRVGGRHEPSRVRAFVDFAVERLRSEPALRG